MHGEKCGQDSQRREMGKHMKVFHESFECPCGIAIEKELIVRKWSPCSYSASFRFRISSFSIKSVYILVGSING